MLENVSPEDLTYASSFSDEILSWSQNKHRETNSTIFKLTECKESFMKISEKFLLIACHILVKNGNLELDERSRVPAFKLLKFKDSKSQIKKESLSQPKQKDSLIQLQPKRKSDFDSSTTPNIVIKKIKNSNDIQKSFKLNNSDEKLPSNKISKNEIQSSPIASTSISVENNVVCNQVQLIENAKSCSHLNTTELDNNLLNFLNSQFFSNNGILLYDEFIEEASKQLNFSNEQLFDKLFDIQKANKIMINEGEIWQC